MLSLGEILAGMARRGGDSGSYEVPPDDSRPDCPECGGSRFITFRVPLNDPRFGKAFPCQLCSVGREQSEADAFRRFSNLGGLSGVSFEETSVDGVLGQLGSGELFRAALAVCREYAESPGGWLVLVGPAGSGKTHLAACVVNRRVELREQAFFVVCADLLDHLRAGYGPESEVGYDELLERVREVPLLALDAVGSHYGTVWSEEKLLQVLDHRYRRRLPTVVTLSVPLARVGSDSLMFRLSGRGGVSRVLELGRFEVSSRSGLGEIEPEMSSRMTFASFELGGAGVEAPEDLESLEQAYDSALAYSESLDGWLVFAGGPASGKTHLAVAVASAARARGVRTVFAFVPSLLDHLRAAFNPESAVSYDEAFDLVQSVDLLVLDGLGAERSTPWVEEKLGQLLSLRYNARRPTVITTSATFAELRGSRPAIWSRLRDPTLVDYRVISVGPYYG